MRRRIRIASVPCGFTRSMQSGEMPSQVSGTSQSPTAALQLIPLSTSLSCKEFNCHHLQSAVSDKNSVLMVNRTTLRKSKDTYSRTERRISTAYLCDVAVTYFISTNKALRSKQIYRTLAAASSAEFFKRKVRCSLHQQGSNAI
jgi:hypothetical protein